MRIGMLAGGGKTQKQVWAANRGTEVDMRSVLREASFEVFFGRWPEDYLCPTCVWSCLAS